MPALVLIRGGGDLATGVALRLIRSGLRVVMTELPQPLVVRRSVAFAEAVYTGEFAVEEITARRVEDPEDTLKVLNILSHQQVPILVDPACTSARLLHPGIVVDARMTKQAPEVFGYSPGLYIGLGPGFLAGINCQVAVETRRGHTLGRVFWQGGPEPDTGFPDGDPERILRAPVDGMVACHKEIGQHVDAGEPVAEVDSQVVFSSLPGVLRGLIHPGIQVYQGLKIGDVDPRDDSRLCRFVSDKALAIGGGVLEAILARTEIRSMLWA
jgi:xanthine dehydrogenase accessory factor